MTSAKRAPFFARLLLPPKSDDAPFQLSFANSKPLPPRRPKIPHERLLSINQMTIAASADAVHNHPLHPNRFQRPSRPRPPPSPYPHPAKTKIEGTNPRNARLRTESTSIPESTNYRGFTREDQAKIPFKYVAKNAHKKRQLCPKNSPLTPARYEPEARVLARRPTRPKPALEVGDKIAAMRRGFTSAWSSGLAYLHRSGLVIHDHRTTPATSNRSLPSPATVAMGRSPSSAASAWMRATALAGDNPAK